MFIVNHVHGTVADENGIRGSEALFHPAREVHLLFNQNNRVGAGLFGFGISKFMVGRWEDKNPEIFKQKIIEEKDERNQMIRNKSQAISGEVIHWALMAGAWIAIFFDAPLWITLAFVGVFLLKTALDIMFTAYYQKRM